MRPTNGASRPSRFSASLVQDLRYGGRMLARNPGFTLVAVITLALGIGGTVAVLSVANALYLRALPVTQPERVVSVVEHRTDGSTGVALSYPDYVAYRDGSAGAFSELAAVGTTALGLRTPAGAETVSGSLVSGNYFGMLGVRPALGRYLLPEDDAAGRAAVAVLSHDAWQHRFGGDPAVIGGTVHLNGQPLTVVGVAGEGFRGTLMTSAPELWAPIAARELVAPQLVESEGNRVHWLTLQGRLAEGMDRGRAEAALGIVGRQLSAERGTNQGVQRVRLSPAGAVPVALQSTVSTVTGVLLVASLLVFLIASVNVAGMLLARALRRRREIAIRLAIGAGTGRLVRQLLTESGLLFGIGGAAGVFVAYQLTAIAAASLDRPGGPLPLRNLDPTPDAGVLGLTLVIVLLAGAGFGLAPALQAVRRDLVGGLKDAVASAGGRATLRGLLVVGQVAMCLILLLGAGLFLRSLQEAARLDLGFEPQGVLTGGLNLRPYGYDAVRGAEFYRALGERLEALPGVQQVSLAAMPPLSGRIMDTHIVVGGAEPAGVRYNVIGPDYFRTLGVPLLRGRPFTEADHADAPPVAIVNQSFAREYFPGTEALGRTIAIEGRDAEIVGVVRDSKWASLDEARVPFAYLPLAQDFSPSTWLLVRTDGEPARLEGAIRREIRALDPDLPLHAVATLDATVAQLMLPQRIAAWAAGAFGVIGLLIAVVGLYGVLAFAVAQRTREIGVRLALGARAPAVVGLVLRQAAWLVGSGIVLGLAGSALLAPFVRALLVDVAPADPLALAGVLLLLAVVALFASFLPARRAMRVDPLLTLRAE